MPRRPAFTLIELIVVIAIIAVLVALVVPGLDRARERGLLTHSISNVHQLQIAGAAYSHDNKETLPFTPVYQRGGVASTDSGPLEGLCPWSFAGRNNAPEWAGRPFDVEAADRPLNPYLLSGVVFEAPAAPATMSAADPARASLHISALQSRGYEDSLQRTFPVLSATTPGITCYQDVGTSYLLNLRWLDAFASTADPAERLKGAMGTFRAAADADPVHLVWLTDQSGQAVPASADSSFSWNNAFDDDNQSVMAFIDGHVSYVKVAPGRLRDKDYRLGVR